MTTITLTLKGSRGPYTRTVSVSLTRDEVIAEIEAAKAAGRFARFNDGADRFAPQIASV